MGEMLSKHRIVFFYVFSFLISWPAWFIMSLVYDGNQPGLIVYVFSTVGGLGPLLSLLLLEKLTGGEISIKQVFSQIKFKPTQKIWFVLAIFAIPLIAIISNLGYHWMGKGNDFHLLASGPDSLGFFVIPVMAIHFVASLVTSPLFEEPGWRGFALVGLQKKFGLTLGSLIVGVLWWVWHQPMNLTFGLTPSIYSALSMIAFSFMIDSLFNLSGGNLFTAMLAHQSYGTMNVFLYQGQENWLQLGIRIVLVIVLRWLEVIQRRQNEGKGL